MSTYLLFEAAHGYALFEVRGGRLPLGASQ